MKVSEKHGVNPTIQMCFWCGNEIGIALLGRLPDDAEAPKKMVLNYDPCDDCEEKMGKGICMMEISQQPTQPNQAEMKGVGFPTGRYFVINEEGARNIFTDDVIDNVIEAGGAYISTKEFQKLVDAIQVMKNESDS